MVRAKAVAARRKTVAGAVEVDFMFVAPSLVLLLVMLLMMIGYLLVDRVVVSLAKKVCFPGCVRCGVDGVVRGVEVVCVWCGCSRWDRVVGTATSVLNFCVSNHADCSLTELLGRPLERLGRYHSKLPQILLLLTL